MTVKLTEKDDSLSPFRKSLKLLRDLADLQGNAPLERQRKEWEETMEQVYNFLNEWESKDNIIIKTSINDWTFCKI